MTLFNIIVESEPPRVVALADTALLLPGDGGRLRPDPRPIGKMFTLPAIPAVIVGHGVMRVLFGLYVEAFDKFPTDEITDLGPALGPVAEALHAQHGGVDTEVGRLNTSIAVAGWSRREKRAVAYVYSSDHGLWGEAMRAGQITGPESPHAGDFPTADAATAVALARLQWGGLSPELRATGGYGGRAILAEIDAAGLRLGEAEPFSEPAGAGAFVGSRIVGGFGCARRAAGA